MDYEKNENETKEAWEKPELTVLGSVSDVTGFGTHTGLDGASSS